MKKIVFATSGLVPYPGLQGSTVTNYSLVKSLLLLGYDVSILVLRRGTRYESDKQIGFLRNEGIDVEFIERDSELKPTPKSLVRKIFSADKRLAFEEFEFTHNFQKAIERIQPDLIIQYTTRVAAATFGLTTSTKRITLTVDLDHIARKARALFDWKYKNEHVLKRLKKLLHNLIYIGYLKKYHAGILKRSGKVITHAHQHNRWLIEHGVDSKYIPLPVGDFAKNGVVRSFDKSKDGLFKIIVVGASGGISTLWGYDLLCNSILPAFTNYNGPLKFEVHLIGNLSSIPEKLRVKLQSFLMLRWRGYVDDLAAEINEADVFLVPTFVNLGFRTRIAEAFSHGAIVVAHSSNKNGMPELINDYNVILADNGVEVLQACERLAVDRALREKLSSNARNTFEKEYDSGLVLNKIIAEVEALQ